jgi:hypothetical protein
VFRITAKSRMTPRNTRNSELSTPAKNRPCCTTPKISAPSAAPHHRAIAAGQKRAADDHRDDRLELLEQAAVGPGRAELHHLAGGEDVAQKAVNMNIRIFTRLTGTPT